MSTDKQQVRTVAVTAQQIMRSADFARGVGMSAPDVIRRLTSLRLTTHGITNVGGCLAGSHPYRCRSRSAASSTPRPSHSLKRRMTGG